MAVVFPATTFGLGSSTLSFPSQFTFLSCNPINLNRSFPVSNPIRPIRLCRARTPGPPPPDQPDPPPAHQPVPSTGITASLSRVRDGVQIFLAVLFWMSLFFWSSAWEGVNSGRRNKGDRFRK